MVKNMSVLDRIVRVGIAALFLVVILAGWASTVFSIIMGIIALILLVSGILGFCPLYKLLHITTKKV